VATTYSLAVLGVSAGSPFQVKDLDVPDATQNSNVIGSLGTAQGGVMSRNEQVLVKNPDGSQSWYTIDAERSIPGSSLVMKRV
jgi:hypothetical protein